MNVIAYNCAYALYPRATFEERMFLFCGRHLAHNSNVFEKYSARGFHILHALSACTIYFHGVSAGVLADGASSYTVIPPFPYSSE